MIRRRARFLALLFLTMGLQAQTSNTAIKLSLDLKEAPRKFLRAQLTIPVKPGPLTLECPKWIPGEHSPDGPIDNVTGLVIEAQGKTLAWRRDDVNMFAFKITVPEGVTELHARVDFLATAAASGFSAGASTGPNLAIVSWNEVTLYPRGIPPAQIMVEPSIELPTGWKFGTALEPLVSSGSSASFKAVPLDELVDSPLLAGRFFNELPLAPEITPKHYLDIAADGPEDLKVSQEQLDHFSNLVRETGPLFRSRHYGRYHFLLTLSDSVAHFGLEHHQSSDDRLDARTFLDDDLALLNGDLLPHEFTHSWNGKFRRPAGLATGDFAQPMKGELLWVYEGLTQYLGEVLAARSGIWTADQYRAHLAASAAEMDHRPGRTWRNLEDTAVAAQILYSETPQWDNWRRSVDYYPEGALIWFEVDLIVRRLSHSKKSLDNFCAEFLGVDGNTPPRVFPYTLADVVSHLNRVQAYDWASFFHDRITGKGPHAPLNGIAESGYSLTYTDQENEFDKSAESREHGVNAWFSLGFKTADGAISDVLVDSPAYKAGLGPDMKIVAVNGRRVTDELLHAAIRAAKGNGPAVELITENAGFFQTIKIDYHEGERYPHLVKQADKPAPLDDVLKALTKHETRTAAE